MGWIVEYQDRNKRPAKSAVFGDRGVADRYATMVKGQVVPSVTDAPPVTVVVCDPPDVVNVRRAQDRAASLSERCAEAYLEAGSQARLGGASTSDALDYAADAAVNVLGDARDGVACAGGCGRTVRGGFTTCRKCARA